MSLDSFPASNDGENSIVKVQTYQSNGCPESWDANVLRLLTINARSVVNKKYDIEDKDVTPFVIGYFDEINLQEVVEWVLMLGDASKLFL